MRKDRGSITIITLTTVLFMLAFLLSTYVIITNRRQTQEEIKRETKGIYSKDVNNIDEVYNSYFADESSIIPIITPEQLLKVGTNEYIFYNDQIYKCAPDAKYQLMKDISFKVEDYLEEYPDAFENSTTWINIEMQIANGTLEETFEFDYNENIITETDAGNNVIIHKRNIKVNNKGQFLL